MGCWVRGVVRRGSLSWGSGGTSPSTSSNAWGSPAQASSPPSGTGVWGPKAGAASGGSSGTGGGATSGSIPRPGSGGGGARPQSAESVGQTQQAGESFGGNTNSSSAWGARPSSASGVLGQAQPLLAQAQAQARPRSADISRPSRNLSEFGDESGESTPPGSASWATRRRLVGYGWVDGFRGECSGHGRGGDERGWVSRAVGDAV